VKLDVRLAELHPPEKMLALHEALEGLERHDPVKCKLVKLRDFAGLTNQQTCRGSRYLHDNCRPLLDLRSGVAANRNGVWR
jgi:hypothetical protein